MTVHSSHSIETPPASRVQIAAGVGVALTLGVGAIAPRLMPLAVAALFLLVALEARVMVRLQSRNDKSVLFLPLVAWWFVCALISPRPLEATYVLIILVLFMIGARYVAFMADRVTTETLRWFGATILCVFALVALFGAIEEVSGLTLRRWLFLRWPNLMPNDVVLAKTHARDLIVPPYMSNRNNAVGTMLFWPTMLIAQHLLRGTGQRLYLGSVAVLFALALAYCEHQSSQLAFVISGGVFCIVWFARRYAVALIAAAWVVACLGVIPVIAIVDALDLEHSPRVQQSGQHRIAIWRATSHEIFERPLIGHGFGASRAYATTTSPSAPAGAVETVPRSTTAPVQGLDSHAHNVFLQVWFESGAIGALLFCIAGASALLGIGAARTDVQPYWAAAWAVGVVMAGLSWSLSAIWFSALFAAAVMCCALAGEMYRVEPLVGTRSSAVRDMRSAA